MIDYAEARELMLKEVRPLQAQEVPVARARGRILARDLEARISSPPFDKAAMDGYAVRAQDVGELPVVLAVVGEVFAGQAPDFRVGPGQAAVITTGSPVPSGADTVVMVEHTERADEGRVRVLKLSGSNVCREGEDVRRGETVLSAGTLLTPLRVGVAASAGHARLPVRRLPAAALLCTGSEVVEPGSEPVPGCIYNANGPMLRSLMAPRCAEVRYLGIAGDEPDRLAARIREGLAADVLVITGGVSMGQYDLVPETLEEAGVRGIFHKVAIKPGKPTFFGRTNKTLVFGMPGNPQSCYVVFRMLLDGALAAMGGVQELPPALEVGRAGESFANRPARMNVIPCIVQRGPDGPVLRRQPYNGSADVVGPSRGDGFFIVPPGAERVSKGQELRFFTL